MKVYDIVVSLLETIVDCDAKNMARIILQYAEFTDLEKIFKRALVQRSITRVMSSRVWFSEHQIIEMIENPSSYRMCRGIELCLLLFLKYASVQYTSIIDYFIEPMSYYLKDYSKIDLLLLFEKDSRLELISDIEYNIIQYLIWMVYLNIDCALIKRHLDSSTSLTDDDLRSFYWIIPDHINYLQYALDWRR